MSQKTDAKVETYTKEPYTRITFRPDLSKFGMDHLESDMVALFRKRVYDVAATTRHACKVYLNSRARVVLPVVDVVEDRCC